MFKIFQVITQQAAVMVSLFLPVSYTVQHFIKVDVEL